MRRLFVMVSFCISVPAFAGDREELLALDQAYAVHWKAGDADAVMSLFTADATLVPHHGDPVVKGHDAIRKFWFDPAFAPTIVPFWTREAHEIFIVGDVGVVRGRAVLIWEYDGTRTTIPDNNYVIIALRTDAGWKIRLLTWNDDPRLWIREPIAG